MASQREAHRARDELFGRLQQMAREAGMTESNFLASRPDLHSEFKQSHEAAHAEFHGGLPSTAGLEATINHPTANAANLRQLQRPIEVKNHILSTYWYAKQGMKPQGVEDAREIELFNRNRTNKLQLYPVVNTRIAESPIPREIPPPGSPPSPFTNQAHYEYRSLESVRRIKAPLRFLEQWDPKLEGCTPQNRLHKMCEAAWTNQINQSNANQIILEFKAKQKLESRNKGPMAFGVQHDHWDFTNKRPRIVGFYDLYGLLHLTPYGRTLYRIHPRLLDEVCLEIQEAYERDRNLDEVETLVFRPNKTLFTEAHLKPFSPDSGNRLQDENGREMPSTVNLRQLEFNEDK